MIFWLFFGCNSENVKRETVIESTLESDIPISFLSNAAIYTSLFLFTILQEFHLVMLNLRISLMIIQTSEEKREE